VQNLYKNTATISWLRFVQDLYRWIGLSQSNIGRLWQVPKAEQKIRHPVRKLPPNDMIESYEHRQLLPGEKMNEISKLFVSQVSHMLRWENLPGGQAYVRKRSSNTVTLSLMDWTSDVFIRTTTETNWGKSIWTVAPDLLNDFLQWEATTWKYVFQLPQFFSQEMSTARNQLIDAFTTYFGQHGDLRKDTSYFVPTAEAELRDIGFDDVNIARVHMLQHWA
jgi:hypothetical protein